MGIFDWLRPKKVTILDLWKEKEKLSQKLDKGISKVKRYGIQADIDLIDAKIAAIPVSELKEAEEKIRAQINKTPISKLQKEIKDLESTKRKLQLEGSDTEKIQSQINFKNATLQNPKWQKVQRDLESLEYLKKNNLLALTSISDWEEELKKANSKMTRKLSSQDRPITPTTKSEATLPPSPPITSAKPPKTESPQASTLSTDILPPPPPPSQKLSPGLLADLTTDKKLKQVLQNNSMSVASGNTNNPPSTPKVNSLQKNKPGQER